MSQWDDPTRNVDDAGPHGDWATPGSRPAPDAVTPPGPVSPGAPQGSGPSSGPVRDAATPDGHRRVGPGGVPELWPGPIPLRPLAFGEIIETAFRVLRFNPRTIFLLSFVVLSLATILGSVVIFTVMRLVLGPGEMFQLSDDGSFPAGDGFQLVSFFLSLVAFFLSGFLVVPIAEAALGVRLNSAESWARLRGRLPALLGYGALVTLIMLALAVPVGVAIVAAVASDNGMVIALTLVVGLLLTIAAYAYVSVNLTLAPVVIVLEERGPLAAMGRSFRLVRGAFWHTLGVLFVVSLITTIVSTLLSLPAFALAAALLVAAMTGGTASWIAGVVLVVVVAIATVLASTIAQPMTSAATVLVYLDRRFRTEALAVELLGEAERMRASTSR